MDIKNKLQQIRYNKFFNDSAWSLIGTVAGKGLALLSGILIARFLGKDAFGEYGMIKNTIITVGLLSTFGLGYTATKFVSEFRHYNKDKVHLFISYAMKITFVFCFIMFLMIFLFADYIATDVLKASNLTIVLRVLSVLVIFNGLVMTQVGVLAGFGEFKQIAKISIIIGIVTFIITVPFTYFLGFNGAIFSLLIIQIINFFLNRNIIEKLKKEYSNTLTSDRALLKEIFRYTFPVALQELSYSVTAWVGNLLLIRMTTYGELGLYNAAIQWNSIIKFIPEILRNVVLSHLSSSSFNSKKHSRVMNQSLLVVFLSTFLVAIVISVFSSFIASFYGNTFQSLGNLIIIICVTAVVTSVSNIYIQAYMSKNLNWEMFFLRLFRDIMILLLFFIMLKNTKMSGSYVVAYSNLCLHTIFIPIIIIVYNKKVNNKLMFKI